MAIKNKLQNKSKRQHTPSFPFFLDDDWLELISPLSLRLAEVLLGDSGGTKFSSLPFDRDGPHGSFLRLRFKTQFRLIILLIDELVSLILL